MNFWEYASEINVSANFYHISNTLTILKAYEFFLLCRTLSGDKLSKKESHFCDFLTITFLCVKWIFVHNVSLYNYVEQIHHQVSEYSNIFLCFLNVSVCDIAKQLH